VLHSEELQCKNICRRKSERFISPSPQSGPAPFYPNAITAAIRPSPFQLHFKRDLKVDQRRCPLRYDRLSRLVLFSSRERVPVLLEEFPMYSSVTSSLKSITGYQIQLEHFFPNSTLSSSSVWSATFSISLSSNLTVL
jgi:hypothetical protein